MQEGEAVINYTGYSFDVTN